MRNTVREVACGPTYWPALLFAISKSFIATGVRKFRLQVYLYRRNDVIRLLAEPAIQSRPRAKSCVAIANVVREEEVNDAVLAAPKVERMRQTIDGILMSFADCELTILIGSLPNRSIAHLLPEYQQSWIELIEGPDCDPMLVGFRLQDELIARIDDHDWFLFLEDDTVIHDATFLRKQEEFHRIAGPRDLLMPHRYEYRDGVKRYIDLNECALWNKLSVLKIGDVKFSEFLNAHAALYFLSRDQLHLWEQSGRGWKNRNVWGGVLESAATYCLLECFNLFKPHPSNLTYLEVRHWDTKYSERMPKTDSPFTVEPARKLRASPVPG
jgi:hypothetical protein